MLLMILKLKSEISGEVAAKMDIQSLGGGHRVSNVWKIMFCFETFPVCGSVCAQTAYIVYLDWYLDTYMEEITNACATNSSKSYSKWDG